MQIILKYACAIHSNGFPLLSIIALFVGSQALSPPGLCAASLASDLHLETVVDLLSVKLYSCGMACTAVYRRMSQLNRKHVYRRFSSQTHTDTA